jgi:hypothetical protein
VLPEPTKSSFAAARGVSLAFPPVKAGILKIYLFDLRQANTSKDLLLGGSGRTDPLIAPLEGI